MTDTPNHPGPPDDGENADLPPELETFLRGLSGGELDPQMVSMMKSLGIDTVDPQMLSLALAQVQQMVASADDSGAIDPKIATEIARKTASAQGDPSVSDTARREAREAVEVANFWLDEVTDLDHPGAVGAAWSQAEWIEATVPVWRTLVDPIAVGVSAAMDDALTKQFGGDDPAQTQLPPGALPPGLLPSGVNPADLMGQIGPMMRRMQGSMFSVQFGNAVGVLAGEILTGGEVCVPLVSAPNVVLMPKAISDFAEGLEIDAPQVRLYLAARESARSRLFHSAPWLGPQVIAAVQDYARDTTIDTDVIEEQLRSIDPSDPEALQQALSGRLFAPQRSAAQEAALSRLETLLALIEGWVDVIAQAAADPHLPNSGALAEAVRRRRATGGPAEKTFASLVGLELRPRRLRDAANLFAALESAGGSAARDAAWAHPDVAPTAADLDDPLGYVERRQASTDGDDFDEALSALLNSDKDPEG